MPPAQKLRIVGATAAAAVVLALAASPALAAEADPAPVPRILSDSSIIGPEGSAFGATMSQVSCDINGNGTPDLAVGTYMTFDTTPGSTGAYVLLDPTGEGGDVADQRPVRIIDSSLNSMGGVDVRCAGDTTGDGFDDLVVTVQGQASFVIFGSADFGDVQLDALGDRGRTITGSVTRANGVGDLNGDGRDEIALTDTRGRVTVLSPADLPAKSALDTAPGTRISGANIDLVSVSRAGDMNGDGREDLAVGSSSWKAPGANSFGTGAIWVITDISQDVTVGEAAIAGFRIDGPPRGYDLLGTLTVGLGDITGSGYGSLLIGGESDEPKSGSAVVVTGGPNGANVVTDPLTESGPAVKGAADGAQRGWWINGIASGDHFGHAVGSARMDGWSMLLASAMDGSVDPEKPSSGYVAAVDSRALVAGTLPLSPSGVLNVADLVAGPVPGGILIPGELAKQNLGRSFADLTKNPAGSTVTFAAGAPALFSWGEIPSVRVVTLEVPAPVIDPEPGTDADTASDADGAGDGTADADASVDAGTDADTGADVDAATDADGAVDGTPVTDGSSDADGADGPDVDGTVAPAVTKPAPTATASPRAPLAETGAPSAALLAGGALALVLVGALSLLGARARQRA